MLLDFNCRHRGYREIKFHLTETTNRSCQMNYNMYVTIICTLSSECCKIIVIVALLEIVVDFINNVYVRGRRTC